MLSAVGTHLGPGRAYPHPFAGPTSVPPSLLPPNTLNTLSPNLNPALGMSATEFARPHPKRYNGSHSRNGSNSSSSGGSGKFSEQSSPVNLAVTNSSIGGSPHSPKDDRIDQLKNDIHSSSSAAAANNLFQSSRLTYGTNPSYRDIDYASLYGAPRGSSIYGAPNLYSSHAALAARGHMHHRNTFIASQLDSYQSYLQQYNNPPNTLGVLVPPQVSLISTTAISSIVQSPVQQQMNGGIGNSMLTSKSSIVGSENHLRHQSASSICGGRNSEKLEKELIKDRTHSVPGTNGKSVGFKVPSGKEGSLKHRILVRPCGSDKDRRKSPVPLEKVTFVRPTTDNMPTNFYKGTLVEVSDGEFKRIEDLRTEDCIIASEKGQKQVVDVTVVKITKGTNSVVITLSYGNHRKKVETEVQVEPEQPFCVYGQGWTSCDPETSMQVYGLKCHQLQVGDVFISLYPQRKLSQMSPPIGHHISSSSSSSSGSGGSHNSTSHHQQHQQQKMIQQLSPPQPGSQSQFNYPYYSREDLLQLPQNLSRRSNTTIPTTATGTAVTSRPLPHHHHHNHHQQQQQQQQMEQIQQQHHHHNNNHQSLSSSVSYSSHLNDKLVNSSNCSSSNTTLGQSATASNMQSDDKQNHYNNCTDGGQIYSPSVSSSSSSSSSTTGETIRLNSNYNHHSNNNLNTGRPSSNNGVQSAPAVASAAVSMVVQKNSPNNDESSLLEDSLNSRKRRWSAPDNICDDEGCPTSGDEKKLLL